MRSDRGPTEIRGPGKDVADWSPAGLVAAELYDHYGDDGVGAAAYDDFENVNLAHEPARRAQVQALAARLRAQFERAPGC